MLLKFRLEMDVIINQDSAAAVIELARQHYENEGGGTVPDRHGTPTPVLAAKFIEGTDQALLELLGHQALLQEAGIEVERLPCRPIESLPETTQTGVGLSDASGQPDLSVEGAAETSEEEELDDFESGLYLCRWPNGDISLVKADSRREAIIELDEWAGAEPAWHVPMDECMIDYPALRAVLSSDDAAGSGVGERTASAAEMIKTAVEHERKRLWTEPRNGTPAKRLSSGEN